MNGGHVIPRTVTVHKAKWVVPGSATFCVRPAVLGRRFLFLTMLMLLKNI